MVEALRDPVGPDQRNLCRRLRDLADVFVLFERNVARKLEPRLGGPAGRDAGAGLLQFRHVPAPVRRGTFDPLLVDLQRRLAGVGVIAFDSHSETVLEIEPAKLAVSKDVEADGFLHLYCVVDRLIFQRPKLCRAELSLVEFRTRLL